MSYHERGGKKAAILAAYDPSKTASQIAAELGFERGAVTTVLFRAKLTAAKRNHSLAEYQACADAGMTRKQCAAHLGVSMYAIRSMVSLAEGLVFAAEVIEKPEPAKRPVKWKPRKAAKPTAHFSASPDAIRRYLERAK